MSLLHKALKKIFEQHYFHKKKRELTSTNIKYVQIRIWTDNRTSYKAESFPSVAASSKESIKTLYLPSCLISSLPAAASFTCWIHYWLLPISLHTLLYYSSITCVLNTLSSISAPWHPSIYGMRYKGGGACEGLHGIAGLWAHRIREYSRGGGRWVEYNVLEGKK